MRAGDGIDHIERTHAIRHRQGAYPLAARISVGGERGRVLARGADMLDCALADLIVEAQHIVARHAENVLQALFIQTGKQVLGDAAGHSEYPPAAAGHGLLQTPAGQPLGFERADIGRPAQSTDRRSSGHVLHHQHTVQTNARHMDMYDLDRTPLIETRHDVLHGNHPLLDPGARFRERNTQYIPFSAWQSALAGDTRSKLSAMIHYGREEASWRRNKPRRFALVALQEGACIICPRTLAAGVWPAR